MLERREREEEIGEERSTQKYIHKMRMRGVEGEINKSRICVI